MPTITDALDIIGKLTKADQNQLKTMLLASNSAGDADMETFLTQKRTTNGQVCPCCGSVHSVRNGHRKDGRQRYLCRDCGKSYVITTNSIASGTRKPLATWKRFVECMIAALPLREAAAICGIHRNTAFFWRHKILDALQNMANEVVLSGIVEADETFFAVSYKGNHKKSLTFAMPRPAHKRGHAEHIRGISHEKVCVPCAVNRGGLSIARAITLGRISTKDLHRAYDGRITEGTTLVTDKHSSYTRFAKSNNINLIQLKGGKVKKGLFHIQHINNYHSRLKKFIERFNGVSTKYLDNYLIWHNFVNYAKETSTEKASILLSFALSTLKHETCMGVSVRASAPISDIIYRAAC